jgi:hypothetical protein
VELAAQEEASARCLESVAGALALCAALPENRAHLVLEVRCAFSLMEPSRQQNSVLRSLGAASSCLRTKLRAGCVSGVSGGPGRSGWRGSEVGPTAAAAAQVEGAVALLVRLLAPPATLAARTHAADALELLCGDPALRDIVRNPPPACPG